MKAIGKNFPSDLYVSTSSWLNPIDLPRLRDTDLSHPVLLDHLIVFDIDVAPLSLKNLEKAKEIAKGVHSFVVLNESVDFVHATFSGVKDFISFTETQTVRSSVFLIPNNERKQYVKIARIYFPES